MKSVSETASYYSERLKATGTAWGAADCGSAESHRRRLVALHHVFIGKPRSVLDVGCGRGAFADYCWSGLYEGWDIASDLLPPSDSRRNYLVRDLYDSTETDAFDYVVASGLFQFSDINMVVVGVRRMWELCRKAVAFNFITSTDGTPGEECHSPFALAAYCSILTPKIVLRMDYLPNDAMVYLYK